MRGRTNAPFPEIVEQLQATLAERAQVITAVKAGNAGPYRFEHAVWAVVDLLNDIASADDTPP